MVAMGILYSLRFVGRKDCTILVHISLVVGFDLSLHIYFINICFKQLIALHRSVGLCSLKNMNKGLLLMFGWKEHNDWSAL